MSRLTVIATLALLVAGALPAGAITRHASLSLSCAEISAIIRREGAAIFRYPSPRKIGLTLFDRYVRDGSFCARHQGLETVYVPSAGGGQCPVRRCTSEPSICLGSTCD
jgi:hypothetical protein